MKPIQEELLNQEPRMLVLAAMVLSSMLSLGLVVARWAVTGHHAYSFYIWNLFLAWIPFWVACLVYFGHVRRTRRHAMMFVLAVIWLLFFPNAPYLWTDMVHLPHVKEGVAWWCDLVMALSFGWNGMLLGLFSLYLIQRVALERWGTGWGWLIVVIALALGSFGIALGRVDRFNSWDVLSKPGDLIWNMAEEIFHPVDHWIAFAITALFFAFLSLAYLTLLAMMGLERNTILVRSRPSFFARR